MNQEITEVFIASSSSETTRSSRWRKVNVDQLATNVKEFVRKIDKILADVPQLVGDDFELSEFQVSTEISGKGELSILGSGVEVAGRGGLSFKFTKKKG